MENLSPLTGPRRIALAIPNHGWLHDHRFLDRAVLPGLYALDHLASVAAATVPDLAVSAMAEIRFDKFLALPASDHPAIEGILDLAPLPGGGVEAVLMTRQRAAHSGIARLNVHARACIDRGGVGDVEAIRAEWREWTPCDQDVTVSARRLYAELVPFGPVFRNVTAPITLGPQGAWATVSAGPPGSPAPSSPLGSFFALDAAFHAACAWAQRYRGSVAFPVDDPQ